MDLAVQAKETTKPPVQNRWTLRFADWPIEKRYQRENLVKMLPLIRFSMIAATVMYSMFGILDYTVAYSDLNSLLVIRYIITLPVLILFSIYAHSKSGERYALVIWFIYMLISALSVIVMTLYMEDPARIYYFAGLIVIMYYGANFTSMGVSYSIPGIWLISIGYIVSTLLQGEVTGPPLWNNVFFLIVSSIMSSTICVMQETTMRNQFAMKLALQLEKERAVQLNREAQAANRAKGEFLAMMSHELRTPLNAIIGFSEIIRREMFGKLGPQGKRYQSYADDINKSGAHLLGIINDVLDLSKAEAGKLDLQEGWWNLNTIVEEGARMLRDQAASRSIQLSIRIPDKQYAVLGDERLLRQALINVVSNAVKFTHGGGTVEVVLKKLADGGVDIRVSDNGIGIARDDIENILEPFVQVESAMNRHTGGTGLGLPLVKKIMTLHDSDIEIDSHLGIGTTVSLPLPAKRITEWEEDPDIEDSVANRVAAG